MESLLVHLSRVCIAVVPHAHHHTVGGHWRHALRMRQRAPEDGLLAVALDCVAEVNYQLAEAFADGGVLVAVLVGADVESRSREDWVWATQVL